MITEWQPIMPDDKLKLKSRCIFEFLRSNHSTFLIVGRGVDQEVDVSRLVNDDDVVAYREFECRPAQLGEPERFVPKQPAGGKRP